MLAADSIVCGESLSAVFRRKRFDQLRIRMEFLLAAVQLFLAAEHHVGAALDGADCATNLDRLTDETFEIAHGFFVFTRTENEEMTIGIGGFGTAYVQKIDAIARVHDTIHMSFNADIFMEMLQGLAR